MVNIDEREETTEDKKWYANPMIIVPIILIVYWWCASHNIIWKSEQFITAKENIYFWGGMVALVTINFAYSEFKRQSPQVIWNMGHGSCTGTWIEAGNYAIIRVGTIRAMGEEWEMWYDKVLVVPVADMTRVGYSLATRVSARKLKKSQLPLSVIRKLEEHNIHGPYYFGLIEESEFKKVVDTKNIEPMTGLKSMAAAELVEIIEQLNRYISTQDKFIENIITGHYGSIEQAAAAFARIHGTIQPKNIFGDIREKLTRDDSNDS